MEFDKAEFVAAPAGPTECASCRQILVGSYYDLGGKPLCGTCSQRVEAEWNARKGGLLSAVVRGTLAAALGAALWIAITRVTGYEIGIVAIVVGAIIGNAVKKASGGHGGRAHQVLAVVLTYLAVTSTYVPQVWQAVAHGSEKTAKKAGAHAAPSDAPHTDEAPAAVEPDDAAPPPVEPAPAAPPAAPAMHPALAVVLLFVFVLGLSLAGPFLGGFDNILGLFIIGFALLQAWRINKKVELKIHGPFALTPKTPEAVAAPAP